MPPAWALQRWRQSAPAFSEACRRRPAPWSERGTWSSPIPSATSFCRYYVDAYAATYPQMRELIHGMTRQIGLSGQKLAPASTMPKSESRPAVVAVERKET